jgi:hypothetical protein
VVVLVHPASILELLSVTDDDIKSCWSLTAVPLPHKINHVSRVETIFVWGGGRDRLVCTQEERCIYPSDFGGFHPQTVQIPLCDSCAVNFSPPFSEVSRTPSDQQSCCAIALRPSVSQIFCAFRSSILCLLCSSCASDRLPRLCNDHPFWMLQPAVINHPSVILTFDYAVVKKFQIGLV